MRARILYLLERPELSGGVMVVFRHAELLRRSGFQAEVAACGPAPPWSGFSGRYWDLEKERPAPRFDLVVGTYYTTLRHRDFGPLCHFCQGYEGDLRHLAPERPAIERAYREDLPTLVVSPHLSQRLAAEFAARRRFALAPPPLWGVRLRPGCEPRRPPWISLSGVFQSCCKGIPEALRLLCSWREQDGFSFRVLRVSALPFTDEERTRFRSDRELCGVSPRQAMEALSRCDLALHPATGGDGFGLPLLEALGAGVPVAAMRTPATTFVTSGGLPLADSYEELGTQALHLLRDGVAWKRARRSGRRLAREFAADKVARQVAVAVRWALECASR